MRTHRDADRCRRQGRRVVDAIADHCHNPVLLHERLDQPHFIFRQQVRFDLINPRLFANCLRMFLAVAGQHDRSLYPQCPQALHQLRYAGAELVLKGDQPGKLVINRDISCQFGPYRCRGDSIPGFIFQVAGRPQHDVLPIQVTFYPETGTLLKVGWERKYLLLPCGRCQRLSKRM